MTPYVFERTFIATTIALIQRDFPVMFNTTHPGVVEHGYWALLISHKLTTSMDVETGEWRLIVTHPPTCGCDGLTDELVWQG